jgi:UDPglucose 6-dehydrogenase
MRITIFGSGYVGLVSSACFAEVGNSVICVDVDAAKIEKLKQGECPIFEPGLKPLLKNNIAKNRIQFTVDARLAIEQSDVIFVAVGTPPEEDGSADLQYVLQVAETIGQSMQKYKVIVNKSTVPVGTADKVQQKISEVLKERKVDIAFDVVSNPEFLKEGCAIADCMKPDRIVVGVSSEKAAKQMRQLYMPFNRNHDKLLEMDVRSAEMTKYAANAMLATKISFMNEMSRIAEKVGVDIESVRLGMGSDSRIGFQFIYPGCGYGGSCFPKDVRALRKIACDQDYQSKILQSVHEVNEAQKHVLFEKIQNHYQDKLKTSLKGKVFALWGLAFKPNTDDIREAPSRIVMEALWAAGAKVQAYDPEAMGEVKKLYGVREDLKLCETSEAVLKGADGLVICTEWLVFRSPDFELLKSNLGDKVIFDGRNLYEPSFVREAGLDYYGIGRG